MAGEGVVPLPNFFVTADESLKLLLRHREGDQLGGITQPHQRSVPVPVGNPIRMASEAESRNASVL
jgi:hypothetical protein